MGTMSKHKSSKSKNQNEILLEEASEVHPFVDWLIANGKNLIYGLLALALGLLVIFQISANRQLSVETDYLRARGLVQRLDQSNQEELSMQGDFDEFINLLSANSELREKYGAFAVQKMLELQEGSRANEYGQDVLSRAQPQLSEIFYQFSQGALLVGLENYEEALSSSLKLDPLLREKLSSSHSDLEKQSYEMLFAFHLLRLASLHQSLGQEEEELDSLNELLEFLALQSHSPQAKKILSHLAVGEVKLDDYLRERRRYAGKV